ncbi:MAG: serine/threonine-protein kinase [Planctomycetota bacterium]
MPDRPFSTEQLELIDKLTERAMSVPAESRRAMLEEACGGDTDVLDEIWELVGAEVTPEELSDVSPPIATSIGREALPDQIGPYKVLERLGEGGFGVVYLAQQTQPVRRKVALKIIKPGMDSSAVLARFEAEFQALALMDHPSVAHVYDGGSTPEGRPYFAMELVKGVPITDFCDRHQMGLRARVELMIKVCEAVQHAHSKAVIHRDLKPSNILVEEGDSGPSPKVIDFGVAKALSQRLTERTLHTEIGQMIGTPEYMSPEQAEHSLLDVDTRSDVYSLGVVLYELLVGRTPFDPLVMRTAGYAEIQRIIRETDPQRPSTRITQASRRGPAAGAANANTAIAQARRTDPTQLSKLLERDLDWIVLKCLEKDRDRRYETASALATDLRRYLDDETVLAGAPSVSYKVSKFVRRNRGPVIAAGVVSASLLIATGVSTAAAVVAYQAQQDAEERAEELQLVADFQVSQLRGLDAQQLGVGIRSTILDSVPEQSFSVATDAIGPVNFTNVALATLQDGILAQSIEAIDRDFADRPILHAGMLQTAALTLRDLGLLGAALDPQQRALQIRRDRKGNDDRDTLRSIDWMGVLRQLRGETTEAESLLTEALERRRALFGDLDEDTLLSVSNLGVLYRSQRQLAEAEPLMREALDGRRQTLGEEHPDTLVSLNNLALLMTDLARPEEAEVMFREGVDLSRRILAEDDPERFTSLTHLGELLVNLGRLNEAEPYLREALEGRVRLLGDAHHSTLSAKSNMAVLLEQLGRLDDAESMYTDALEGCRETLMRDHPITLRVLNNLGFLLNRQGRTADAEPYFREAIEGRRRTLGENHIQTLISTHNLAGMLRDAGDLEGAEVLYRRSVSGARQELVETHPFRMVTTMSLGRVLGMRGLFEEGERELVTTFDAYVETPSADARRVAEHAGHIVEFYEAWHAQVPGIGHDERAQRYRSEYLAGGD